MKSRPILAAICFAAITLAGPILFAAMPWLPVEKDDLDRTDSHIDPEANAEILYHLQEIDDKSGSRTTYRYYYRLKIYNEKGVQELDKIDLIPFYEKATIKNPSARVITPTGEIINISDKEFHTRELARQGSKSVKVTSFAFPQLTAGAIVEWQVECVSKEKTYPHRVNFQSSIPIREFKLRYRALDSYERPPVVEAVNCPRRYFSRSDAKGYFELNRADIPALKSEPLMPPIDEVQQWIFFYYTAPGYTPEKYYADYFKKCDTELKSFVALKKKNDPVQAKCDELLIGAKTDDEKLARLHDFCRTNIRHITRESSGFTPAELEKMKPNKTAAEVLANGYGDRYGITALFIALARAAGYDANIGLAHDRSDGQFNPKHLAITQPSDLVAVVTIHKQLPATEKTAAKRERLTHVYDPASIYLPARDLHWFHQNTKVYTQRNAYGPDNKPFAVNTWVTTPLHPAAKNLQKRTATLRLDTEGTLEGDILAEPQGSFSVSAKNRYSEMTPEAREKSIRESFVERFSNAEITNIVVRNHDSPLEPVSIAYHIRIPNYADITGQRIFVQPSFFRKNLPSVFTAPTRSYDIDLGYPWAEEDNIELTLPEGYSIDAHSDPTPIAGRHWFTYETHLSFRPKTNTIIFKRLFSFTTQTIPRTNYALLKTMFDGVYTQDNFTITLSSGK